MWKQQNPACVALVSAAPSLGGAQTWLRPEEMMMECTYVVGASLYVPGHADGSQPTTDRPKLDGLFAALVYFEVF